MIKSYIENANFEDTGFSYTMSLINGKHKMVILYCLMEFAPVRFNQMRRYLKTVTDKTLSMNLKELEADGLILRQAYQQMPPQGRIPPDRKGGRTDEDSGPALRLGGAKPSQEIASPVICLMGVFVKLTFRLPEESLTSK